MTNDSHGAARGYGPFRHEDEPTAPQTPGSPAGTEPTAVIPAQWSLPPVGPADGDYDEFGLGPSTSGARFGADAVPLDPHGPSSGGPAFGPSSGGPAYGPVSGGGDAYGFGASRPGPRIEPSPPPQRNRIIIGLVAGLLAGLIVFGAGGFFLGRSTGREAAPAPAPSTPPSAEPSLGLYEQSQVTLNQAKLTGAVGPIAQSWLPHLSSCARNGDPGGPPLNPGEKSRVRCRFDGMSAIFVEYANVAERDKARVTTLSQNVDARTLTPGVGAATETTTPSGRTTGNYVEYAYTVTENKVKQTVSGIWWDDAQTPVAAYILAYWKDGVGQSWGPMREVWARYA